MTNQGFIMITLQELMNPPTEFVNFNLVRSVQRSHPDAIELAEILRIRSIEKLRKVLNYYEGAKYFMVHAEDEDELILNAIVANIYFNNDIEDIEDDVYYVLNMVNEFMCKESLFSKLDITSATYRNTHDRFEHIRKMATQHVLSLKSLDELLKN